MKVEYIICENKAERDAVLIKLEKNGYIWANGESLTECNMEDTWADGSIALHLNAYRQVTWSFTRSEHRQRNDAVSAQNYLYKHKPILITRKGRVVTAEDKNTGEKAIATCSPTDTFDFGTGAMIAVARLIAQSDKGITKDAETVLRQLLGYDAESPVDIPTEEEPKPFKVGSLVTLRPDVTPGIEYNGLTLQPGDMYDIAFGKPIKVIRYDSGDQTYLCEAEGAERMWWYDSDMLEPWDESKIREGDKVHVKKGCTKDRYDTYYQWLKDNISDIDLLLGFERSDVISTMYKYTVVKIAPHGHLGDVKLAFIKRTNGFGDTFSYLYDIDALEKVTEE